MSTQHFLLGDKSIHNFGVLHTGTAGPAAKATLSIAGSFVLVTRAIPKLLWELVQ